MKSKNISLISGIFIIIFSGICYLLAQDIKFLFLFLTFVGIVICVFGILFELILRNKFKKTAKILLDTMICGTILFSVSFLIIEGIIIINSKSDEFKQKEYVLVLGAGLHGEKPSLTLLSRLELAKDYLDRYPQTKAILCGGLGKRETISESEAMAVWLISNGIEKERLIKEDKSKDTVQNIKNAKLILKEHTSNYDVALITNSFHMYRSNEICIDNGITALRLSAKLPKKLLYIVNYYLREYFSVILYYMRI